METTSTTTKSIPGFPTYKDAKIEKIKRNPPRVLRKEPYKTGLRLSALTGCSFVFQATAHAAKLFKEVDVDGDGIVIICSSLSLVVVVVVVAVDFGSCWLVVVVVGSFA